MFERPKSGLVCRRYVGIAIRFRRKSDSIHWLCIRHLGASTGRPAGLLVHESFLRIADLGLVRIIGVAFKVQGGIRPQQIEPAIVLPSWRILANRPCVEVTNLQLGPSANPRIGRRLNRVVQPKPLRFQRKSPPPKPTGLVSKKSRRDKTAIDFFAPILSLSLGLYLLCVKHLRRVWMECVRVSVSD